MDSFGRFYYILIREKFNLKKNLSLGQIPPHQPPCKIFFGFKNKASSTEESFLQAAQNLSALSSTPGYFGCTLPSSSKGWFPTPCCTSLCSATAMCFSLASEQSANKRPFPDSPNAPSPSHLPLLAQRIRSDIQVGESEVESPEKKGDSQEFSSPWDLPLPKWSNSLWSSPQLFELWNRDDT